MDMTNNSFCMAPWIHMHFLPTGKVTPCCVWPYDETFGDVGEESLFTIWNNEKYKDLRMKMLNGESIEGCKNCNVKGEANAYSLQGNLNRDYAIHKKHMLENTTADGTLEDFKMSYFDVRYSNICNFKCRGCSPELSSAWLGDYQKLYNYTSDRSKFVNIFPNEQFEGDIKTLLPTVEEAYFAGGEPLMMKEHYEILDELIATGKTDTRLTYNTNLSKLKFKTKHIVDYWSQFPKLVVGVSIDDLTERGEYFRKGMDWDETVSNIRYVKEHCPHAVFYINCTINVMNIYNLCNLHEELINLEIIPPDAITFNLMLSPEEYSIQILPREMKADVENRFKRYLEKVKINHPNAYDEVAGKYQGVLNYMLEADCPEQIPTFLERTKDLDKIRSENFAEIFPELKYLNDKYSQS